MVNIPVAAHIDRCVLCGNLRRVDDSSAHGEIRGNTSRFIDEKFPIWKCDKCNSIMSLRPVDYADIYRDYPVTTHQRLDFFARGRYWNLLRRLRNVGLKSHHRILDWGCGGGVFVEYLKTKGYVNAEGYDPYVTAFSSLSNGQKFDFVIVNDVIEHVDDPRALLRECATHLAEGGVMYIGTADSEDVRMNQLEREIMKLHQPFHRVIMTQRMLVKLGDELTGFERLASYRRSYMDTLIPFVNYRFLDEFNRALDHEMDRAFRPDAGAVLFKKPMLLVYAYFGYFYPSAYEPAIIVRRVKKSNSIL